jgi:23S rRNA (cytidine2498-2'-O)-methyltransferase
MNPLHPHPDPSLLLYCRPGFEGECAQEITIAAALRGKGHAHAASAAGFVDFQPGAGADESELHHSVKRHRLIFARQCLVVFARLADLPRGDRLTPIMAALSSRGERYCDAWIEAPDTNDGKALAPFCKSFGNALIGGLKRARLLDSAAPGRSPSASEAMDGRERPPRRLHAFFPQSDKVYLAAVDPAAAPWPQGIPRLKFPRDAPSRSTLKLDGIA